MWAVVFVHRDKEILQKTREELLEMKRQGKELQQSEWLTMCVKETLRLTFFTDFIRGVEQEFEFGGYKVKKGTVVRATGLLTHFDPNTFPEPFKFDPLRWKEKTSISPDFSHFLVFGGGFHVCKGNSYALQAVKTFLAVLVEGWELECPQDLQKVEIDFTRRRRPKHEVFISLRKKEQQVF